VGGFILQQGIATVPLQAQILKKWIQRLNSALFSDKVDETQNGKPTSR